MLFKLTSTDIRDTALVDCATDEILYRTSTCVAGPSRSPASSTSSLGRSWARANRSYEKLPACESCTTAVLDRDGETAAEIVWNGRNASVIRIEDDVLQGATELFDAAFVRVLPDETFLPTRMEYTWRIAPETLTLLDDDGAVIGRLHTDCSFAKGRPVPAMQPGKGNDYLEFEKLPSDELLEVIVTYLLVTTLRERLYSVTKYVYGQRKRPLANLRLHASRSFANLRDSLRRTMSPSSSQH
ncbi:hypothetical protein L226DRAFT_203377 [Lentinus tigrinus ALCF2SS1-7]|uniref:DUF6593 domain-containing protein n=1 Tax=Lentinus tigrinus ALCF2SS1-6 TaxID=1328759 RepID=A0A5C2SRW3_9APHY|nr:hypothetical protein L227DRAFT_606673 [Lentinus tigrinus ALCF2SS1-6]RPD80542.1 hypothetical protein L226DRAFT_203377 [Lentinus tigrinus ALCF2SS1-7]